MSTAWIGLGSNLGDRPEALRAAAEAMRRTPGVLALALSPVYETAPVGPPQPPYLNACARLRVEGLSPLALLERMLAVEARLGRQRRERWGPRTLDLDLLLYDQVVLEAPGISLPHPRLTERAFVLRPLLDLDAGLCHPVTGRPLAERLNEMDLSGVQPFDMEEVARG